MMKMQPGQSYGSITRISFEYGLRLLFENNEELVLYCPFTIQDDIRLPEVVDPEHAVNSASTVLPLLHSPVVSAQYNQLGAFVLVIREKVKLHIAPHPDYEAWHLYRNGKLAVVCLPGGGVAEF